MNHQTELGCPADATPDETGGRSPDTRLFNTLCDADTPEVSLHDTPECTDPDRQRPVLLPGDELGRTRAAYNELTSVFLHELRNCLGAIRNAAGVLRVEFSADPATVKARSLIERQVVQMTRLVEDLVDISRARSGQLPLQCERIDLRAVAASAAQTVEITMQQHHLRMTTSLPGAPVWLQADPGRLEQVFVNLLINAAKYTDAQGEVFLSVERYEGEAVVRIRDTGIGIDPGLLPRVFDLFVQADPLARRSEAGLGVGLALVRSLVERHGGRITVASAGPGHGSEFTVSLPLL
jgi:signal transduction histidine kinase